MEQGPVLVQETGVVLAHLSFQILRLVYQAMLHEMDYRASLCLLRPYVEVDLHPSQDCVDATLPYEPESASQDVLRISQPYLRLALDPYPCLTCVGFVVACL